MVTASDELTRISVPVNHSVPTAKLIELLRARGTVGATLTDEELTAACGKDTRPSGKGYPTLGSAIRFVFRNHGIVWGRVKGAMAIKCLNPQEILEATEGAADHIRRTARRSVQKLNCVALDTVDPKDRPKFLAVAAQHGTIAQFAKSDTRKALETRGAKGPLDLQATLKMFGSGN